MGFTRAASSLLVGLAAFASLVPETVAGQLRYDREYPAIGYSTRERTDRVARLRAMIASGDAESLSHDGASGYLRSLLDALEIPVSSQMLVFTTTSFQGRMVSPQRPRAIYYNDDTYIAFVQDSDVLEISAVDPVLGGVFYSLAQSPGGGSEIAEEAELCLACHDSYGLTGGGVPRHLVGSMLSDENGRAVSHEAWSLTDDRTPFARRWGGWYVTGTHADMTHRGNVIVRTPDELTTLDYTASGNRTNLDDLVDATPYPGAYSDVVALMVLEHQVHVQNRITRLNYDARTVLAEGDVDGLAKVLESSGEDLVRAMVFVEEARIEGPVVGSSTFSADFMARGPRDRVGRSLRELDLQSRLFRYPVSYLIYSEAFRALPAEARTYVYGRLDTILSSPVARDDFEYLSAEDRVAIREILVETIPDFAAAAR